jgi:hypothetical protein
MKTEDDMDRAKEEGLLRGGRVLTRRIRYPCFTCALWVRWGSQGHGICSLAQINMPAMEDDSCGQHRYRKW